MLSIGSSLILGFVALAMIARAHFEFTRMVAAVPALMAVAELYFASVLEPAAFPVLTALLMLLRVAAVVLGVVTLRTDAALAMRRREARRRFAHQTLCVTHGIEPVAVKRAASVRLSEVA